MKVLTLYAFQPVGSTLFACDNPDDRTQRAWGESREGSIYNWLKMFYPSNDWIVWRNDQHAMSWTLMVY